MDTQMITHGQVCTVLGMANPPPQQIINAGGSAAGDALPAA